MAGPRIFVSHSSQDAGWCTQLVDALKDQGFDVWYDQKSLYVGAQWVQIIQEELAARDVFLVVLTPDAWASPWVQKELALALAQHKQILGVIHKPVQVAGFITTYQLLDATSKNPKEASLLLAATLSGTSHTTPRASAPMVAVTPPSIGTGVSCWSQRTASGKFELWVWYLKLSQSGTDITGVGLMHPEFWKCTVQGTISGNQIQLTATNQVHPNNRTARFSLMLSSDDTMYGEFSVPGDQLYWRPVNIYLDKVAHLSWPSPVKKLLG